MRSLILHSFEAFFALASGLAIEELDNYVLSLNWSLSWCALKGGARSSPIVTKRQISDGSYMGFGPGFMQSKYGSRLHKNNNCGPDPLILK